MKCCEMFQKENKVFQIKPHTVSLEGKLPTLLALFAKQTRNCYENSCNKLCSQLGVIVIEKDCTLKALPNIGKKWHLKFLEALSCAVSVPYLLDKTPPTLQFAGIV